MSKIEVYEMWYKHRRQDISIFKHIQQNASNDFFSINLFQKLQNITGQSHEIQDITGQKDLLGKFTGHTGFTGRLGGLSTVLMYMEGTEFSSE